MPIKNTGFWKLLSSVKLAIWLLAVIAVLSLAGTLIPQNEAPEFYMERFGQVGYSALSNTGLVNAYESWWFILSLALFSLNLTVCLLNRLPFKKNSAGTIITHSSILVIFAGAFLGMVFGEKGLARIYESKEVSSFVSKGKNIDLGFSIRLDDFIYNEYIDKKEKLLVYPAGEAASHASHGAHDFSAAGPGEKPIAEAPTNIGVESYIAAIGSKVKVLRYVPDFVMDMSTKSVISRSNTPNNPAIEVELKDKAGSARTFWVFARYPDIHKGPGADYKFVYQWVGRRPKDYISKVTILQDGKEALKKDIRVNEPLDFGGYRIFQSTYDTEALGWSGLQIVKDPGVSVVYAGFILLITGFIMIFYVNPILQRK